MLFNFLLILAITLLYLLCACRKNTNRSKREKVFLIIAMTVLFVLVAIRDESMGNDTIKYLDLYTKCAEEKWNVDIFGGYYDSGYLIFNILLSYISPSRRFFMIVMSLIFNLSVYRFIKNNSKNYLLSVLIYIGLLFFYSSMTMMRQFMAMSIMLESIKFAKEKRIVPFILLALLALTIHSTAILAFFIYPIYNTKYKSNRTLAIIASSIIATLFIGNIYASLMEFLGRNTYYLSRIGNSENISSIINFVIYSAIGILLAHSSSKERTNTNNELSPYIYSSTASASLSIMSTRMNILSRADDYFSLTLVAGIPNMIEAISNNKNKKIAKFALVAFILAFSSAIIGLRPEWNTAYNYKPCFSKGLEICTK